MNIVILDNETTTFQKGNPYSRRNRLCLSGILSLCESDAGLLETERRIFDIEFSGAPYNKSLNELAQILEHAHLIVGFNLKFDLNWIKRYVPHIKFPRVWDCQLAHFIDLAQTNPYPSLDEVASYYGLPPKLDVVRTQYWENGIDTPDIPYDTLAEYLQGDLSLTAEIFKRQWANQSQRALKELHNEDLLRLVDCESNGLPIRFHEVESRSEALCEEIKLLETSVRRFFKVEGKPDVNIHSSEQLSILLYGGKMYRRELIPYTKQLKSGPVQREKLGWVYDVYPPRIKPSRSAESDVTKALEEATLLRLNEKRLEDGKKPLQRLYSVEEPVLRSLPTSPSSKIRQVLKDYIRLKELLKIKQTYYEGLQKLNHDMDWKADILHPVYNQCVVVSGRLSSSKPNAQNLPIEVRSLVYAGVGNQLIEADAKQLEWICVSILSKDEVALEEIRGGVDQHEVNRVLFGLPDRLIAKIFVFRLIFGGSAFSYAKDPDFSHISKKESYWQDVIDKFYTKYRGIAKWHKELVNGVVKSDGTYVSPTGRRYIFELERGRTIPRTKILNYPVQGFAAEIMAIVRVILACRINEKGIQGVRWLGTVHDSILLEAPSEVVLLLKECICDSFHGILSEVKRRFQTELPVGFGVKVKAGNCWATLQEI